MKSSRDFIRTGLIVVLVFAAGLFVASVTGAAEKTYEIHPDIAVEGYRSDASRVLDAYENLMNRYMNMVEGNMKRTQFQVDGFGGKLESIESKLDSLSERLSRIEKALDIKDAKAE